MKLYDDSSANTMPVNVAMKSPIGTDATPTLHSWGIRCGAQMSTALKARTPGIRVSGVEPVGAPALQRSLKAGALVTLPEIATAFGLFVAVPAGWAFNYFNGKVEGFNVEMDNSSSELLDYFIKQG